MEPHVSELPGDLAAHCAALAASATAPDATVIEQVLGTFSSDIAASAPPASGVPYSRKRLHLTDDLEVMVARWAPGARCAPHDHGGSGGFVVAADGDFVERRFRWSADELVADDGRVRRHGEVFAFGSGVIHDMVAPAGGVTLHLYAPAPQRMSVFDIDRGEILDLVGDFGAWIPDAEVERVPFSERPRELVWICHTTSYRGGSAEFAVAVRTMARERAAANPDAVVSVTALTSKSEFRDAMEHVAARGDVIRELHVVGHSGMYGPMFGSIDWPEQFSPHEWKEMVIPFAPGGQAWFHACRTARWFAPFFARTFGVTAWGNQNYTTVSSRPDRFSWAGPRAAGASDLHLVATPGKKSHGPLGSVRKYLGAPVEPMVPATPSDVDRSYDSVAALYDRAYTDITVREAEWAWVLSHARSLVGELGRPLEAIEIGCGNGAMLRSLDDHGLVGSAHGFDASGKMIDRAIARSTGHPRLSFRRIHGPSIELPDASVDVVVSFLSFRYLDWDPLMNEVRRVLRPGGRLWVVDMVEKPVRFADVPLLVRSWRHHRGVPRRRPEFARDLAALTSHPDWRRMVAQNPIRAEHEYRWYLESRFAPARLETLTTTLRQRVVAFDSGPLDPGVTEPLSYP